MRKLLLAPALVVLLTATTATLSQAQYNEDTPSRFAAKVGLYRPSGSSLRSNVGSTWTSMSVSYFLTLDQNSRPASVATFESIGKESDKYRGRIVSLQYTRLWRPDSSETRGVYYGVGLSANHLRERNETHWVYTPFATMVPEGSRSGSKLGAILVAGYDFNENWFAEARYHHLGEVSGLDFSGLMVSGGAKFAF